MLATKLLKPNIFLPDFLFHRKILSEIITNADRCIEIACRIKLRYLMLQR